MNPDQKSALDRALAEWTAAPRRNPDFRAAVWAKIEASRRAPSWGGYARSHAPWIVGAMALAVILGAIGGRDRAQAKASADRQALAASYVHALDARWMREP